jgi:tetratricopeptide (TPR) repeat protein
MLQIGLDSEASLSAVHCDSLSSKLSQERDEISKLKISLDAKLETARGLVAATISDDIKKKTNQKRKKSAKSNKELAEAGILSAELERCEKLKAKKKTGKSKKGLAAKGNTSSFTKQNHLTMDDSEDEIDRMRTSVKTSTLQHNETTWDAEQDAANKEFGDGFQEANLQSSLYSEQNRKLENKRIVKFGTNSGAISSDVIVAASKSLTNTELVTKLKNLVDSARKFSANALQLMSAHQSLVHADNYLAELKERISGLGIVGHAERFMLVAFRQESYKLILTKGNLCMILKAFPDAVQTYTRAFEFCDWMPEILFLRAQAYMQIGEIASAQKDLEATKSIVRDGFIDGSQNPSKLQFQKNAYMALVESLSDTIASAQSAIAAVDDEVACEDKMSSKQQAASTTGRRKSAANSSTLSSLGDGSGNNVGWPRQKVFTLAAECDSMIHSGFSNEVIKKCDALLAEDNSIGLVWALRGRALLVLGQVEEGLKNINRGVTCWGECYECRLYRALAYRQSDPSAAEADLDLCAQMSCCGSTVYILRASIKEALGQNAAAAVDWEQASRKDSSRRNEFRFRACRLLFEENRRSECLHMLERLRSSSPNFVPTYLLHADLLVKMGNLKGAITYLSRAVMIEPWNALLYFKRAQILSMKDRARDSMRDLVMFFRNHGAVKHKHNDDGEKNGASDCQFEILMIELHCKALIHLQYWQDVILLLHQNERLVSGSCSLQVQP